MTEVLSASHLGQRRGRKWVLRNLDLEIRGGITALLGPNGAGKTTFLETAATLRQPAEGSLRVLGSSVTTQSDVREARRRCGFLPQHLGYYPGFTAREFVKYAAWLKLVPGRLIDTRTEQALDELSLLSDADRKLRTLSGGTIRRVGIAQAIVHRPELVFLDEPTVGLDPEQRFKFRNLLKNLVSQMSFVISTHLVDDVRLLAEQVLVMSNGRFVFDGTVSALEQFGDEGMGDSPLERGYSNVLLVP